MGLSVFPAASASETWTLISSQTPTSGSTVTFSLTSTYKKLRVACTAVTSSASAALLLRYNGDSGSNYAFTVGSPTAATISYYPGSTQFGNINVSTTHAMDITLEQANTSGPLRFWGWNYDGTLTPDVNGIYTASSAISAVNLVLGTGTFTGNSAAISLYGVA